jgi:tellurite resistance protein TerC
VDNLFVFIVLMAALNVPRKYQQEALMVGIILALILRGVFIAAGYQLINLFSWVFYVFGAFLIWTAWRLVRSHLSGHEEHPEENRIVRFAQEHLNVGTEWRGLTLWWKENGTRVFSPMIIVIIALGVTDVLFALDSIPAIFGVTQEPYLVFTANVFALMGLRQLYFLIGGLLERLVHLAYGLGFLLAFIGVKLVFHALHENELPFINGGEPLDHDWLEIPIWLSLVVIVGTLVVTAITSLAATRLKDDENAPSGAVGPQD